MTSFSRGCEQIFLSSRNVVNCVPLLSWLTRQELCKSGDLCTITDGGANFNFKISWAKHLECISILLVI